MADHLSSLQLDEAVAGLTTDPAVSAHLAQCAECASRVEQLAGSGAALLKKPEPARQLNALLAHRPKRRWPLVAAAALVPLAATLLVFVSWKPDGDRLKGATSLEVLSDSGVRIEEARVGQHVTLAVGGGGYRYAAIIAVPPSGKMTRVWPPTGAFTGPIGPGARVRLEPGFEVTPGSVTLYAFFTDEPVKVAFFLAGLEAGFANHDIEGPWHLAPSLNLVELKVSP